MSVVAKWLHRLRCHLVWRYASAQATLCYMGTELPHRKGDRPLIFGPLLLWPNAWMHQDATWYGGRPQPRRFAYRWRPSSPLPKRGHSTPSLQPMSIVAKRLYVPGYHLVRRYASAYRRRCLRWGRSSPSLKGHSPQFLANARCGQTAGWTKMPLGMDNEGRPRPRRRCV